MNTITALVVPPEQGEDGTYHAGYYTQVEPTLEAMQALAAGGGTIELIAPLPGSNLDWSGAWNGYCDEEGRLKHLPANHQATALAGNLGWRGGDVLHGVVVFVGADPESFADLPARTQQLVTDMFGWEAPEVEAVS